MTITTPDIKKINSHIENLFKEWQNLQPLKKEDQKRFDKKIRLDWNYNSNHIEGNTLTYNQTEALLISNKEEGGNPPRDYKEMKAHDLAIEKIKEHSKDERKWNEVTIRELNKILLKEPFWKEAITSSGQKTQKEIIPGEYKKQPNCVKTEEGKIFEFVKPYDVPIKMSELIDWFNREMESPTLSIASFIAELHHKFIVIHPFDDGNGRIARLWINYILLRWDYPPLIIPSEDKRNYFTALQKADHGDINPLTIYLGKALMVWLKMGIRAAKGEDISEPGDIHKRVDLFVQEERTKGLRRYLSKESAIHLIDNLYDPLFETFKKQFKQFNELFDSIKTEQVSILIDNNLKFYSPDPDKIEKKIENKKDIKEEIESHGESLSKKSSLFEVHIKFLYNLYRGRRQSFVKRELPLLHTISALKRGDIDSTEPFSMKAVLTIRLEEHHYKVSFRPSSKAIKDKKVPIDEKRDYNQILNQEDINEFIEKGKAAFFSLLDSIQQNE